MTHNRQDSEDLVQETALRAYRNFDKFEQGTNFKAWIMTIMRNVYVNAYRKTMKEPSRVEWEEVSDVLTLANPTGSHDETFTKILNDSIDKLPEEIRTLIVLFYVEDFSYKEIAKIMHVPIGTVMSRLYTARQLLKKRLAKYLEKEGSHRWIAEE